MQNIELRKVNLTQPTDAEVVVSANAANNRVRFVDSAARANNDNATPFRYNIGNLALLPEGLNSIRVNFRLPATGLDYSIEVPFTK